VYAQSAEGEGNNTAGDAGAQPKGGDNVVDAEFEEVKEGRK
jgi:hypothetical protein